ncbi:hypothetical protein EBZ39_02100 [bacterium]|nr:hypothetical protein [bacterium]
MSLTKASYSMITGAYVNVIDYGATGDGTTNDAAAIQAAFSAADTTPPKTVYFPAGTYLTNSTLTVNPNTTNGVVPQIVGEGSQATIIKAGSGLGANPILKHQGASPSTNSKWTGFQLLGTGAANGQYGIHHINTCFVNYDDINFNSLQEGVRFENAGGGFSEQNVLSNCWAAACKYFLGFARQAGSTEDSFRGTGFSSECHMDLTTVANARLVRVYLLNSLAPNCYNMPIFATIWTNATSAVLQNDSATPIRASGYIRYESSATGWVMGTGSALTTDTFRGIMDGIAFNPTPNTCDIIGIVNGSYYTDYGTFTPVLNSTGGAPTVTYAANGQQGFYEVVGTTVNFSIFLNITSYTGGSGNLQISGLPLTSRTNTGSVAFNRIPVSANKLTFTGVPFARVASNSTYVDIVQTTSGNDEAAITLASLNSSNSALFISGSYTWAAGN